MQELLNANAISLEYELIPVDPYSQVNGSGYPNTYGAHNSMTPVTSQGQYEGGNEIQQ